MRRVVLGMTSVFLQTTTVFDMALSCHHLCFVLQR